MVAVHAAAITPAELTWDPTWTNSVGESRLPMIPSHEISGVAVETGSHVTGIVAGQDVYGLIDFYRDGGAAEYVVAKADELAVKPRAVDHVHAAAIPLSALTAWQALRVHFSVSAAQRVLIHGGAGGVGSFAVQLAKYFGAATTVTCSTLNAPFMRNLGAEFVIEYDKCRFEEFVKNADLVIDTVGGETLQRSWGVLRRGGTLISVVEPPSHEEAARFGVNGVFFIVAPNRSHLLELTKLVDAGYLRPIVSKIFPLSAAREAYELAARGHMRGKIVLRVR